MSVCKVCNAKRVDILKVKEKHFSTFDEFEYLHCLECGSLVIKDIPDNLNQYYSTDYYSFQEKPAVKISRLKKWVRVKYWQHIISKESKNIVGCLLKIFKKPAENIFVNIISKTNVNPKSKILDIGCGNGELLKKFHQFGYFNILGLDPNVGNDIYYEGKKLVIKTNVEDYAKEENSLYDLIMFNHSFEHLSNPEEVLMSIKKLSHKDTLYLIRIPISSSYAFEYYKENWVQLDAPRHLFIYSEKGIRLMLENYNFEILDIVYDSTEFQFWGSEQYLQNISLFSEKSYSINKAKSIFSEQEILNFREQSKKLNKEKKGDSAAFIFKLNDEFIHGK